MPDVKYLYHYTSVDSLALILKNKTIRLNPLDKMDDLQEQKTADVENLGKFVFVSSWTDDPTESIPMWKMYTNSTAGVRIKLRKNPFVWHGTLAKNVAAKTGMKLTSDSDPEGKLLTFLDLSDMMVRGYVSPQAYNGKILEKVQYTNDLEKLEPTVVKIDGGQIQLNIGSLGRYKNKHWEFQNEWRYIMTFMSMNFRVGVEMMSQMFTMSVNKMAQGKDLPPFRFFDLDINPEYFEEMEIVCSPQMTAGNRVILETLVEKYNPSATIRESELLNLI
jgi:hypothetical protein